MSDRVDTMPRAFATAERAAIHASTGVNMGRQGFLAYYLVQMLSLVTGNLDRRGGNVFPARGVPAMASTEESMTSRATPWGDYRPAMGTVPGALLADLILSDEEPIRAMIVMAGNPALSIAGGERLEQAFASLELLVTIDFYRNATGEFADWVLPAADWFEREDLNFFVQGMQRKPYLQWTDAVVQPKGERKTDAWILSRILQEMNRPSLFDVPGDDWMAALWDGPLSEGGYSVAELREAKGNTIVLPDTEPGSFIAGLAPNGRFDCRSSEIESSFARADRLFEELLVESGATLKLITRRTNYMLNSALQNLKALRETRGGRTNPLYMNPGDARDRGLRDGQWVIVRNAYGELRAELEIDDDLAAGTVAMTHGFGNENASGMPVAQSMPGVNVNVLSPSGPGTFDPVGGMSQLTGIAVEVEPA